MLPKTVIIAPQQPMLRVHALRLMLAACSLLALSLGSARPALAQVSTAVDNKGTEFFMAFLPNNRTPNAVAVHLTADVATDVTVQYAAGDAPFETTVAVEPGSIEIVELPLTAATAWTSDTVSMRMICWYSIPAQRVFM